MRGENIANTKERRAMNQKTNMKTKRNWENKESNKWEKTKMEREEQLNDDE